MYILSIKANGIFWEKYNNISAKNLISGINDYLQSQQYQQNHLNLKMIFLCRKYYSLGVNAINEYNSSSSYLSFVWK